MTRKHYVFSAFCAVLTAAIFLPASAALAEPAELHKMRFQKGLSSSVNLRNESYEQHLDNLHAPRGFAEEQASVNPGAYVQYRQRVLVSRGLPQTNFVPGHRYRNTPPLPFRSRKLTEDDYDFLNSVASSLGDENASAALSGIVKNQQEGVLLNDSEYDFLMNLSKGIQNDHVAYRLVEIAEKRRREFYT